MLTLHPTVPILTVSTDPPEQQLEKQGSICAGHTAWVDEASAHLQLLPL